MLTLTALAGFLLGPVPVPEPSPRLVATTKYRVEHSTETFVDLSGVGQPNMETRFSLVSWIAVTVTDTTGGRVVHVTVDSMQFAGEVPTLGQLNADSAKGGSIHGFVDPEGRVKNLSIQPEGVALLSELQGFIHSLFPRMKPGARAGEAWTDSLEIPSTTAGANLVSQFRISYTAGSPESVEGIAGLRVTAATSAKVTGSMENPMAGSMEVEGIVSGESSFVIAPDGRILSGTSSATSDQIIKLAQAPAPIPLRVKQTVTTRLLK
jgi:hypothetical protein